MPPTQVPLPPTLNPSVRFTGKVNVKLRANWPGSFLSILSPDRIAAAAGAAHLGQLVAGLLPKGSPPGPSALAEISRWHLLEVTQKATSEEERHGLVWEAIFRLLALPEVEWAEPDAVSIQPAASPLSSGGTPQGTDHGRRWHLEVIGAPAAWQMIRDAGREPGEGVIIGHLDTGWTPHEAIPRDRFVNAGKDFWDEKRSDASDPMDAAPWMMPGHGTGTLCLLAADHPNYQGVALRSRVLPVRISNSVVHVASRSMALGILHCALEGAQVLTLSAGGLPSKLWADAVNTAYEMGVVICAAAGNNFHLVGGVRTPSRVVYPAHFNRVLACAGITFDEQRYWYDDRMSGNYGPEVDVAAPTPDVHWALASPNNNEYDPYGAGTSTATPQVAATAALWLSYYRDALKAFSPVERVEACRWALIQGARDVGPFPYDPRPEGRTHNELFGDGRLHAVETLKIPPRKGLAPQPADDVSWALLKLLGLFPAGPSAASLADRIQLLWTAETNPEADPRETVLRALRAASGQRRPAG